MSDENEAPCADADGAATRTGSAQPVSSMIQKGLSDVKVPGVLVELGEMHGMDPEPFPGLMIRCSVDDVRAAASLLRKRVVLMAEEERRPSTAYPDADRNGIAAEVADWLEEHAEYNSFSDYASRMRALAIRLRRERASREREQGYTDYAGARASSEAGPLSAPAGRTVAEGGPCEGNPGSSPGAGATSPLGTSKATPRLCSHKVDLAVTACMSCISNGTPGARGPFKRSKEWWLAKAREEGSSSVEAGASHPDAPGPGRASPLDRFVCACGHPPLNHVPEGNCVRGACFDCGCERYDERRLGRAQWSGCIIRDCTESPLVGWLICATHAAVYRPDALRSERAQVPETQLDAMAQEAWADRLRQAAERADWRMVDAVRYEMQGINSPEPRMSKATPVGYEVEEETDGRWIADYPLLPGCMTYGATPQAALQECIMLRSRIETRMEGAQPERPKRTFGAKPPPGHPVQIGFVVGCTHEPRHAGVEGARECKAAHDARVARCEGYAPTIGGGSQVRCGRDAGHEGDHWPRTSSPDDEVWKTSAEADKSRGPVPTTPTPSASGDGK